MIFEAAPLRRSEEAIAHLRRAKELDPLSNIINVGVAWAHYFARQYDQAIEVSRQNVALAPDFWPAHPVLGWALEQKGKSAEAREAFKRAIELSGRSTRPLASLAHSDALSGNQSEALEILEEITESARQRYVSSYFPTAIYAGLGRREESFQWLETSRDRRTEDGQQRCRADSLCASPFAPDAPGFPSWSSPR